MQPPSDSPPPSRQALWAYAGPFGLFIALQAAPGLLRGGSASPFWLAVPEFWLYPLQTVLCAAVLLWYRAVYPRQIGAAGLGFGLLVGLAVFVLWISPQTLFHAAPRLSGGFNPHQLPPGADPSGGWYAASVGLRFTRLVLVVPALEEVFWRGFLLRYLVREDFLSVPFGVCTRWAFLVVTLGFMLEHSQPDWPAALVTGALYNLVAIRTRSLLACSVAHAVTNLLLGCYIMHTQQWGFW